jgi:ferredoxin
MKIKVDRTICSGHARCAAVAPSLYVIDSQGYSIADGVVVPEGQEQLALLGARSCPERAITLLDDAGNPLSRITGKPQS